MINETGVEGIYVVHGISGYESREIMLDNVLHKQFGLPYELVTESRDTLENEALIRKYFKADILKVLNKGALYCTLVHILIYEKIIQNNNQFALIFENDVCFIGKDFIEKIALVVNEAKQLEEGFIISLEHPAGQVGFKAGIALLGRRGGGADGGLAQLLCGLHDGLCAPCKAVDAAHGAGVQEPI